MIVRLTATLFAFATAAAAGAQSPLPPAPVAVVVSIATPPGAPRALIEGGIRKAVPDYRRVPGLLRKYFTIGDGNFGGIYLFVSRVAAEGWFNAAWKARVTATYKSDATLTYYDVPVVLDNAPVPVSTQAPR